MEKRTAKALIGGAFMFGVTALSLGVWQLTRLDPPEDPSTADKTGAIDPTKKAKRAYKPKHMWRSVRARHWQIISTKFEERRKTDAREGTRGTCSEGMVEVKGNMLQEPSNNPWAEGRIETMQLATCTTWIQKQYPERCAQFDRDAWLKKIEGVKRKPMHFCIDRYEYPNIRGQYPMIFVSWYEAKELCDGQGKRLCNEDEWTFACEGDEGRPYPYGSGYKRDARKCITDRQWKPYNESAMNPRDGERAGNEMDRLWGGKRAGRQKKCRSTFGVYDMTGNIDEWTTSTRKGGKRSILKGGYWGPVRTRCRPSTRSHDKNHVFYQQGFRCCSATGSKASSGSKSGSTAPPLPRELK